MSEDYLLQVLHKIPHSTPEDASLSGKPNPFVVFSENCLVATYLGQNLAHSDTTSIQSKDPANRHQLLYYFEITLQEFGQNEMCVGFADSDFPMNKHPGFTKNSYGYNSDGQLFTQKKSVKKLLRFRHSDIVGCGINFLKKEIFFTRNGDYLGPVFSDIDNRELYATLGMRGPKQKVRFNFGREPFRFDLNRHVKNEKDAIMQSILSKEVHNYDVHQIVQSYLYFNGYFDTLQIFEQSSKMSRESINLAQHHKAEPFNPNSNLSLAQEDIRKISGESDKGQEFKCLCHPQINQIENHQVSLQAEASVNENQSMGNGTETSHLDQMNLEQEDFEGMKLEGKEILEIINNTTNTDLNSTEESSRIQRHYNEIIIEEKSEDKSEKNQIKQQKETLFNAPAPKAVNSTSSSKANGVVQDIEELETEEMNLETEDPQPPQQTILENNNSLPSTLATHKNILETFRMEAIKLISNGQSEQCARKIMTELPMLLSSSKIILPNLYAQAYVERVKNGQIFEAVMFARKHLSQFLGESLFSFDEGGRVVPMTIEVLMGLVSTKDYTKQAELVQLMSQNQRLIVADIVNKAILEMFGCGEQSVLETVLKQLQQTFDYFKQQQSYIGEIYQLQV